MSWQHYIVVGDMVLSVLLFITAIGNGVYRRYPLKGWVFLAEDTFIVYCLIAGAQEWNIRLTIVAALYVFGSLSGLPKHLRSENDYFKTDDGHDTRALSFVFMLLFMGFLIWAVVSSS